MSSKNQHNKGSQPTAGQARCGTTSCYDDRHAGLPFLEKKDDPKLISVMKKALETNKKIKVECEEGSSIIKVKFGGEYEGN